MENVTPVEILMLRYVGKGIEADRDFPEYWKYQYNVNAQELVVSLLNRGFLKIGDIDVSLQHMEAKELKEILAKAGLKVSGKKGDLVARIVEGIDKHSLLALHLQTYIVRSEKGEKILAENEHLDLKEHFEAKIVYDNKESVLPTLELIANKKFKQAEANINNLQSYDKKNFAEFLDFHIETLKEYEEYELRIKSCIIFSFMSGNSKGDMARQIMKEVCGVDIPNDVFQKVKKYLITMKDYLALKEMDKSLPVGYVYGYNIKSMNDERCCDFCQQMEGRFFAASEAKIGITYPPFNHCKQGFCRCYVSAKMEKRK